MITTAKPQTEIFTVNHRSKIVHRCTEIVTETRTLKVSGKTHTTQSFVHGCCRNGSVQTFSKVDGDVAELLAEGYRLCDRCA